MKVHSQDADCSAEESGASHCCDVAVLRRSCIVIAQATAGSGASGCLCLTFCNAAQLVGAKTLSSPLYQAATSSNPSKTQAQVQAIAMAKQGLLM